MKILLATDLHFTDKAKDKYRFGIFPFLKKQIDKQGADLVIILGDLTDQKDRHSALLTNIIVTGLTMLANKVKVIIAMGNHDYHADPNNPFFNFLNKMNNIEFVKKPTLFFDELFVVPHIKTHEEWDELRCDKRPKYAFIHQTVTGAISESGQRLDGFSLRPLKRLKCPVFAGDVHKPHTIEPVTYIGPPYHVRFGDNFNPRCMVLNYDTGKTKEIYFEEAPHKWSLTIREPEELLADKRLRAGDHCKVKCQLTREEVVDWANIKKRIVEVLKSLQLESYGIELMVEKGTLRQKGENEHAVTMKQKSPSHILGSFCNAEKLPRDVRKAGLRILNNG